MNRTGTEARNRYNGSAHVSMGWLEVLLFVDDLAMLAETTKALQHNLQELMMSWLVGEWRQER